MDTGRAAQSLHPHGQDHDVIKRKWKGEEEKVQQQKKKKKTKKKKGRNEQNREVG